MNLEETILKLKEAVWTKKGTGQPCETEEKALKAFEEAKAQEDAEREVREKGIVKKDEEIKKADAEIEGLRDELIKITESFQGVAVKLFEAERARVSLFEDRNVLRRELGLQDGREEADLSIRIGSPRVWWAEEAYNPLSEDFRLKLILNNRDYYGERRGRPRRVRQVKSYPEKVFVPEMYESFIAHGITPPPWMERAFMEYQREAQKLAKAASKQIVY